MKHWQAWFKNYTQTYLHKITYIVSSGGINSTHSLTYTEAFFLIPVKTGTLTLSITEQFQCNNSAFSESNLTFTMHTFAVKSLEAVTRRFMSFDSWMSLICLLWFDTCRHISCAYMQTHIGSLQWINAAKINNKKKYIFLINILTQ